MTLSKDEKALRNSLLSDIEGNIQTLNGTAETYVNGKEADPIALIDETIEELATLKNLLKWAN